MTACENLPTLIFLMGPTAAGKTALAVELAQRFPCDIISVDSAMVYRGMDIGTAKPDAATLALAPHRLIDIVDASHAYSAGEFHQDALGHIAEIHAQGRIPLLVGGTMMYFRILQQGLACLPRADAALRADIQARGMAEGWTTLHAELAQFDPLAARRIHWQDSQRLQRALEVYYLTGKPISHWQQENTHGLSAYHCYPIALIPSQREQLHHKIAERFQHMLALGLVEEVEALFQRGDLTPSLPSMRSVGYQQVWRYLMGEYAYPHMCEKTIIATRQLAKRQMTWLRSWPHVANFDPDNAHDIARLMTSVSERLARARG